MRLSPIEGAPADIWSIYQNNQRVGLWVRLTEDRFGGPSGEVPREVVDLLLRLDDKSSDRLLVMEWSSGVMAATELGPHLAADALGDLAAVAVFVAGRKKGGAVVEVRQLEIPNAGSEWLAAAWRQRTPVGSDPAGRGEVGPGPPHRGWVVPLGGLHASGEPPVTQRADLAVPLRVHFDARLQLHRPGVNGLVVSEPARDAAERARASAMMWRLGLVSFASAVLCGYLVFRDPKPFPVDADGDGPYAPRLHEPSTAAIPLAACDGSSPEFRRALRCTVGRIARGVGAANECKSAEPSEEAGLDLDLCGLFDRARDGWLYDTGTVGVPPLDAGELAVAQACFVVLDHPQPYALGAAAVDVAWADPDRLLRGADAIGELIEAVGAARAACDVEREGLEAWVSGAIVGTYVGNGDPGGEARELRAKVAESAEESLPARVAACFEGGMGGGREELGYQTVCGAPDDKAQLLVALEGPPGAASPVVQYARARFGAGFESPDPPDLWSCDAALSGTFPAPSPLVGAWGVPLFTPSSYTTPGPGSQLLLEAGLTAVRAEQPMDACWRTIGSALATWPAAWPVAGAIPSAPWPSPVQQACGEACAVFYGFAPPRPGWHTPQADLSVCRGERDLAQADWLEEPPRPARELLLPATTTGTAADASPEAVCAFNLVAQGRLDLGRAAWLPGGVTPRQWAGEGRPGVAGGADGALSQAIAAFEGSSLQQPAGASECGAVALQCFAGLAAATSSGSLWSRVWESHVRALSRQDPGALADVAPWCELIAPYLRPRTVTEELDATCREGVEAARRGVRDAIGLAAGSM